MKILVIIVTYNAMQWIDRCLSSVRQSGEKADMFVVDNGSTDGSQDYIRQKYPEVIFRQSGTNLGFGKANNIGLQYALDNNYDYVYLLNQDAWIFPETLGGLIEISKEQPEYGILSPFQMNADMKHIDCYFSCSVCSWDSNPDILLDLYNGEVQKVYPVPFVMAAHWFMTRECIVKVGGFSPSFPHYGEDNNYAERVSFWKLKIGIVPSLRVVHDRGMRVNSLQKEMYLSYTKCIRRLSSVNTKNAGSFIHLLHYCVSNIIAFRSIKPIRYFFKILFDYRKICRNRIISTICETAFLHVDKVS